MTLVQHVFGRTITFRYTPKAAGEEFVASSLVSARLYDEYPNEAQRTASDGSEIQNVTSWTLVNDEGTGSDEYVISFNAVDDPEPNSSHSDDSENYYVALNYVVTASQDAVQDVVQLFLTRPRGSAGKIRVSAQDVYDLDDEIENVAPDRAWTERKIDAAIEDIVAQIEGRGYDKRRVFNWEKLNACAKRLAAAYCCFSLASEGSQYWQIKAERWEAKAQQLFDSAKLGYDLDNDGQVQPEEKVQTGAVGFLR